MKKKEEPIVPISKTTEMELRDEVEKLKLQILEASKSSSDGLPVSGIEEMKEKLKIEIDYEYDEAAKALGFEEKILMVREKAAKGRNLTDHTANPAVNEKIEQLKEQFRTMLPSAPNYPSLVSKLQMLEELSKPSFDLAKKSTYKDELKLEINNRFSELMDRPDILDKMETLKAEIGNSDIESEPELKEKVVQLREELESEFKFVLKSADLQVVPTSTNPKALAKKIEAFGEEVTMVIDDVVKSSDLREKIEALKAMVVEAGSSPDEESKNKIQALVAEIKQEISDAVSFPELKERLTAQILEESKSSNRSLGKGDSEVTVNVENSRSFA